MSEQEESEGEHDFCFQDLFFPEIYDSYYMMENIYEPTKTE